MSYEFLFTFFLSLPLIHLAGRKHFPFSPHRYKIFTLFFQQKMSPLFFLSLACSLSLFLLVDLRWPVAYFLFFPAFLFLYFQICGHNN